MGKIRIQKIGITKLHTDAIVNAANEGLWEGGGVCGAIFKEAGSKELTKACRAIGGCKTGNAVITPGFNLPAKHIIHAVGPRWSGGSNNEPELLYSAYKQALSAAKENNCYSVGFPLISAGIFGYPVDQAWRKAIQACVDFINNNPDYEIEIVFAVLDDQILAVGEKTLQEIVGGDVSKANKIETDEYAVSNAVMEKAYRWCQKYEVLFRVLYEDEELRKHLRSYSVYQPQQEHKGLYLILRECIKEAYDDGVVIANYRQIIENGRISDKELARPTKEWVDALSKEQILACIAWHFRRDHFNEGSWTRDSVAEGHMLVLGQGYLGDFDRKE